MQRYFTHYWANKTWENNSNSEGELLEHIAGNMFFKRGVQLGDIVYVVTVIKGNLYLCGKLEVGLFCNFDEASSILNTDNLWEAEEHIIASKGTQMKYDLGVPLEIVRKLRFVSGSKVSGLKFRSSNENKLDEQTLRTLRELSVESAIEFDNLLSQLEETSFLFDDNDSMNEEPIAEEVRDAHKYLEGATKRINVNVYERNSKARKKCIEHWKVDCFICGFNFQETYGDIGKDFIHVHHLKPLNEINGEYEVDPIEDLRPVCPNCHAMIHRKKDTYTIEEIKRKVQKK